MGTEAQTVTDRGSNLNLGQLLLEMAHKCERLQADVYTLQNAQRNVDGLETVRGQLRLSELAVADALRTMLSVYTTVYRRTFDADPPAEVNLIKADLVERAMDDINGGGDRNPDQFAT
jgi:hypothetical protein